MAKPDQEFTTAGGNRYLHKVDHRAHGNPNKSQWAISPAAEVGSFDLCMESHWIDGAEGWGLHLDEEGMPAALGTSARGEELRIAKFVGPKHQGATAWHGYPADYRSKQQDRPVAGVLELWLAAGYIQKYEMARVRVGKPCSLSA